MLADEVAGVSVTCISHNQTRKVAIVLYHIVQSIKDRTSVSQILYDIGVVLKNWIKKLTLILIYSFNLAFKKINKQ